MQLLYKPFLICDTKRLFNYYIINMFHLISIDVTIILISDVNF